MNKKTFSIYQIPPCEKNGDLLFISYERLKSKGLKVDRANYECVYTASLEDGVSLEDLFTQFNVYHPSDYRARSLSVSDVVVLDQNGRKTAHYVDAPFGYVEVPGFCAIDD